VNTMTNKEIVSVVTAFDNGEPIEFGPYDRENWHPTDRPEWDFKRYRYRVVKHPHVLYARPCSVVIGCGGAWPWELCGQGDECAVRFVESPTNP